MKKLIQNTSMESESIVQDSSVNEMEKSFAQEAMETNHEDHPRYITTKKKPLMILKEFGVDSDAPDLFSSESDNLKP